MADKVLRVKVNGMISFSLIGLITYLYKSKGHGIPWDWPFRELALSRVGPFEKSKRLINLINYYRN